MSVESRVVMREGNAHEEGTSKGAFIPDGWVHACPCTLKVVDADKETSELAGTQNMRTYTGNYRREYYDV